MTGTESEWVVLKFGGTSVTTPQAWETVASVVGSRLHAGLRPLVVHSALSGVSDGLEQLVAGAARGDWRSGFETIAERHWELARRLRLDSMEDLKDHLEQELAEVERVLSGIELLQEVTPRAHARALAAGELLATRIGAAALVGLGIETRWEDARSLLRSERIAPEEARPARSYLAAQCTPRFDPALLRRLSSAGAPVVVTQGFIASNSDEETVVFGRGGSDTSAAYLGVALGASRVEIWTDVPGMFTADPRLVPSARLLRELFYDEAQEIATTGSRVLHPRCVPAVRDHGIPIHIRSTADPDLEGTVISAAQDGVGAGLKAISAKKGVLLVSMETVGMWQEVGFLASAFERFRARGLSIDLVSTSETNVTVSLDAAANTLDPATLAGLVDDLTQIAGVRLIEPCAAISLVGRGIRSLLPKLGPALEVFEEERVHLVAQAASDLNFTFVVDEDQAERLVKKLHHLFLSAATGAASVGPTWDEIRSRGGSIPATSPRSEGPPHWWVEKRSLLLATLDARDAAYVYDLDTVKRQARLLAGLDSVDRVLYAVKANAHPDVLRAAREEGMGMECVSAGEVEHTLESLRRPVPLDTGDVLFTPNFAPRREYELGFSAGVHVTVDGLHPLHVWPDLFRNRDIFLRFDTGRGRGHHEKVRTAGPGAKFGIEIEALEAARTLATEAGATVVGLHVHSGSGILDPDHWGAHARFLAELTTAFDRVRVVDLGGGLGVPDRSGQPVLDLGALDRGVGEVRRALGETEVWLEPGRFVVADAGVLLARVTQLKRKEGRTFVGLATGMNSLMRPALYGAHHEIVNLTRIETPATEVVTVVGPICETGDRFGIDRLLPPTEEGDVILVAQAGAYGRVMSSSYNLRAPAEEVVL